MSEDIKNELTKEVQENLTKMRDEKCVPIAQEILQIIASFDCKMGGEDRDAMVDHYLPLKNKIIKVLLEKEVPIDHVGHINRLMLQPLDFATNLVANSLNESMRQMQIKLFKKEIKDLTVKELDDMLKA